MIVKFKVPKAESIEQIHYSIVVCKAELFCIFLCFHFILLFQLIKDTFENAEELSLDSVFSF